MLHLEEVPGLRSGSRATGSTHFPLTAVGLPSSLLIAVAMSWSCPHWPFSLPGQEEIPGGHLIAQRSLLL